MKNNGMTLYICAICGNHTTTLHEVIFGRGNKKICQDYNIQVPLCQRCYSSAHGIKDGNNFTEYDLMSQNDCIMYFCNLLEIDPEKTTQSVKQKSKHLQLDTIKDSCSLIIKGYEV
jgi:ABC-type Na+ transport system ATPase subunit NatA